MHSSRRQLIFVCVLAFACTLAGFAGGWVLHARSVVPTTHAGLRLPEGVTMPAAMREGEHEVASVFKDLPPASETFLASEAEKLLQRRLDEGGAYRWAQVSGHGIKLEMTRIDAPHVYFSVQESNQTALEQGVPALLVDQFRVNPRSRQILWMDHPLKELRPFEDFLLDVDKRATLHDLWMCPRPG